MAGSSTSFRAPPNINSSAKPASVIDYGSIRIAITRSTQRRFGNGDSGFQTRPRSVSPPPFEEVVAEYGPTVLRVCRAVLGPADAEDAWSETFLAALRAYPRLRANSNVEAWLVTIAHRKALDHLRASRRLVVTDELPER